MPVTQKPNHVYPDLQEGFVHSHKDAFIFRAHNTSGDKIYAGRPITYDTANVSNTVSPNVKPWTSVSTPIIGWCVCPSVVDYDWTDTDEYVPEDYPVPGIDDGIITVVSETAFTPAQFNSVFIRHTAGAAPNDVVGRIRNAAVAGQTAALGGVRIHTISLYNGLYLTRLRITGNFTVTANT
jgi:hypothetical protein